VKSYRAVYRYTGNRAGYPGCLLGGVLESRLSAWELREEAELFLSGALEVNRAAGRPCEGEVIECADAPEIFRHECAPGRFSPYAQARGGHCPTCKRILSGGGGE